MKALSKSLIITTTGYITGSTLGHFIIYPAYGLSITLSGILSIGLIFTCIALVTNYCSLKAIEYFESKDGNETHKGL